MNLTPELGALKDEIKGYALEYGLDFFETIFEMLDYDELNEVAAFGGFPTRYPHWRHGMSYEELSKGYSYGLQKIYEMVINNDPCYAYLLSCNAMLDQKLVIAHVYGHSDFFKNNMWFSRTDRKMMDRMANHATKVRRYAEKYGYDDVERFIDCCLSIENLIDPYGPFIRRHEADRGEPEEAEPARVTKLKSKPYMDRYINPPEYLEDQARRRREREVEASRLSYPREKVRDVPWFLLEHAPLKRWEQEILSMIRDEAYYFAPQAMTKIMNEGWATYWHSKIMTTRALKDSELIDYADHHSGTLGGRPGVLNPYKIGVELFRDIEDRWNRGAFGPEYEACDDLEIRKSWNRDVGAGREKIFQVRRIYNDVSFIDAFLTEEFCQEHKLFFYQENPRTGQPEIVSREFHKVKQTLLFHLTNAGNPIIYVQDANHRNRGELYLWHQWEGLDIQQDRAFDTLRNVHRLWQRPVHLETQEEGTGILLSFDGEKPEKKEMTRT
jgi:stage V sporulation protein R